MNLLMCFIFKRIDIFDLSLNYVSWDNFESQHNLKYRYYSDVRMKIYILDNI